MNLQSLRRRWISATMLAVLTGNTFLPSVAFALTSGPMQPEFQGFKPAGVTDMVNLESGDFKYNIPLLDIDGYPINLNYQSGVGIEDEASWVGLGWSLTTGAINRQVRGLPDDFAGNTDIVRVDQNTKPKVTVGGKVNVKAELFGTRALSGTLSLGLFSDNYTGIGAEVGANVGISLSFAKDGAMTAGLGLGVLSNTQYGADASISPFVNMDLFDIKNKNITTQAGLSASLGYNSRSGTKSLTMAQTFGYKHYEKVKYESEGGQMEKKESDGGQTYSAFGSTISYNTEPISPNVDIPIRTSFNSYSFDIGPAAFGLFGSIGGTGYKSVTNTSGVTIKPAFGFLYAEQGKRNSNALMDFIREKDNPIIPETPNIAIPIHTPDMWSYSSQTGSGQFRLYRGGSGIFFDSQNISPSSNNSTGGDYGGGAIFHGGITRFEQDATTVTQKWVDGNQYIASSGDFQDAVTNDPNSIHASFRQVGEKGIENEDVNKKLKEEAALAVNINKTDAQSTFTALAGSNNISAEKLDKGLVKRRPNHTDITYLTAAEAARAGLEQDIKVYNSFTFSTTTPFEPPASENPVSLPRVDEIRKANHISEINVTGADGKRMVYGVPVYNNVHEEYSFAVSPMAGLVTDPVDNSNNTSIPANPGNNTSFGVDGYYRRESKSPYATSYLLSAILSPDYVDKTGNGISNDDLGTAIRFKYSRTPVYRWRSPVTGATFNKALLADPDDNKGSVVYGEKELWYISSIESKTKIAYFITEDRTDALGTLPGWSTGCKDVSQKQRRLREIRLYSKADLSKPIKVVRLDYDYTLCPGVPNSSEPNGGKLTLTSVRFFYGKSGKGNNHPYKFYYANPSVPYINSASDRWGTYKPMAANQGSMKNDYFPYATQNKSTADLNAAVWCLNRIDLPTGGTINVAYEAKDYAYVQDKKATVMMPVTALKKVEANGSLTQIADASNTALKMANAIQVNIGEDTSDPNPTNWFKKKYLNGSDYMYTKLMVKMQTNNCSARGADNTHDFVPCYAKIKNVTVSGGIATIEFEPITEGGVTANPILIAAWQKLKTDYPRYAYPGFNNRIQSQSMSVPAALSAVLHAIGNLGELTESFYSKAYKNNYATAFEKSKSFVKLVKADGKKLGGGVRVQSVKIKDNWKALSGSNINLDAEYGQVYKYTTMGDNGVEISSGVATYEPSIGNDENALKQPLPYIQKIKGAINNYFNLELPFCESLYPAPSIVYSKVTVQDMKDNQASLKTGYTVNEFYTAKDFPTKVSVTPLQNYSNKPSSIYNILTTNSREERTMSQGYSVTLNDMSGKLKSTRTFNQFGAEIASTVYEYRTKTDDPQMLDNYVNAINESNFISQKWLGRDIEFFTDFREQYTSNVGTTLNLGVDVFGFPPIPVPHKPVGLNNEYKLFRSASALKVVQLYGILRKVIKTQNGSSIATEDMVYDQYTGEPVVTRTQNEFNNYIYSVNLPAYWVYKNMGGAYKTSGTVLADLTTNDGGEITAGPYFNALTPGDELINLSDPLKTRYWVVSSKRFIVVEREVYGENEEYLETIPEYKEGPESKFLTTREGGMVKNFNAVSGNSNNPKGLVKVVRSGYRNILNAKAGSIVCLNNPIVGTKLDITTTSKVINANATRYSDQWVMPERFPKDQDYDNHPYSTLVEGGSIPPGGGDGHSSHGLYGVVTYNKNKQIVQLPTSYQYLQGRFNIIAVWPGKYCANGGLPPASDVCPTVFPFDQPVGFEVDFEVNQEGTYYVGYSGNDQFEYKIDNDNLPHPQYANPFNHPISHVNSNYYWYMYPKYLNKGKHHLRAEVINRPVPEYPGDDYAHASGGIALEIYQGSLTTIRQQSSFNTIFSTINLKRNSTVNTFRMEPSLNGLVQANRYRYHINPYIDGFLGNWRDSASMVFQQNRTYTNGFMGGTNKGVDVKNAGYINNFSNYWKWTGAKWEINNPTDINWVMANAVSLYDKYGQQLENKDALGRYSAALFDFNGELPAAVASNAMNREIFTASFEDAGFQPGAILGAKAPPQFLNGTSNPTIVTKFAHSGNRSALLPSGGLTLATTVNNKNIDFTKILVRNVFGEYNTASTNDVFYPAGFTPRTDNPQYILNFWVYDRMPFENDTNVNVKLNGTNVDASDIKLKAIVEGWKLMEVKLNIATGPNVSIQIVPPAGVNNAYVDDIRIFPANAQMKTYAYDALSLRLMAELDENSFATFYEYDDEGTLIRVKKETDKGVVTLKENRSAYKYNP